MIDIHSHILPLMDDGAESFEQALSMARIAVSEGIDIIVTTSHLQDINEQHINTYFELMQQQSMQLQTLLDEQQIPIQLRSGAEIAIHPFLLTTAQITSISIQRGHYLLLELPPYWVLESIEHFIYSLRVKGFIPILAHPERDRQIIENPNLLYQLVEMGALSQITSGSITGRFGTMIQKCARTLVEHKMVHVVGTDAHSDRNRSPKMRESIKLLTRWVGADVVQNMTEEFPRLILEDQLFTVPQPEEVRHRRWFK